MLLRLSNRNSTTVALCPTRHIASPNEVEEARVETYYNLLHCRNTSLAVTPSKLVRFSLKTSSLRMSLHGNISGGKSATELFKP